MSNSHENVMTRQMHGKFGNQVVYKTRDGVSYAANVPKKARNGPAVTQVATRDRFKMATQYGKKVIADPIRVEPYQAKATLSKSAYVLAVADYMKPPRISEIDVSTYEGKVGDVILVAAMDNFKVKSVKVKLADPDGVVIEQAECHPDPDNIYWIFTATTDVPTLTGMTVTAIAKDTPGHSGQNTMTLE